MADGAPSRAAAGREVVLSLPFTGLWLARNSPARRVPSHGTDLMGERYAIDFVGVDERGRSAGHRDWRTLLATEPPDRFVGFGRPILAPGDGVVVAAHDGEPDHEARRSQLALVPYMFGQVGRIRQGVTAIAGNHVVIELAPGRAYAALVHLRAGSLRVAAGNRVTAGQQLAACGNSGNSTQPHVHLQVMDSADLSVARGVPMAFRHFRERPAGAAQFLIRQTGVPGESAIVEPLPAADVNH
ncbi:M23 family metallopeptidase [Catellatospora paridis]|uniref:M23 family metallopeptidase n=1 Tax=Catellatospora paridis TaxID=1617086 RepID=UPI0012D3BC1E|nr:M23 family metallopeptidase [Catellatospora paridis]